MRRRWIAESTETQVLAVLKAPSDSLTVWKASQIASHVGRSPSAVRKALSALQDRGEVRTWSVDGVTWWWHEPAKS
jgi:predicted ArsR family transcriptional regulator